MKAKKWRKKLKQDDNEFWFDLFNERYPEEVKEIVKNLYLN